MRDHQIWVATGLMALVLGGVMSPAQALPDLSSEGDPAETVLELVNEARADAGWPELTKCSNL